MRAHYLIKQLWLGITARSSSRYWERRYAAGLTSGSGSYGELANYKAAILNEFVRANQITSVIEFGCGDGNQLSLANYPRYLGLDVSKTAVANCAARFKDDCSKSFLWYDPEHTMNFGSFVSAQLTLSLDVVYHLLEDSTYDRYLNDLFQSAQRYAIIYSSDKVAAQSSPHVRHRKFTFDVQQRFPEFTLLQRLDNPHSEKTFADFHIYRRNNQTR